MSETGLLSMVFQGMRVIDAAGDDIGKVDLVRMGADPGATEPAAPINTGGTFLGEVFDLRGDDEPRLPPSVRERYRMSGFFRVDGKGWIDTDRYVLAEQIADVSGDTVRLTVPKEDLPEA